MPNTLPERLAFVVDQIWGPSISRGEARAITAGPLPTGWETRERYWAVPNARSAELLVPCDRRIAARTLGDYAGLRRPRSRAARRILTATISAGIPLSSDTLRVITPVGAPPTTVAEIGRRVGAEDSYATFGVRTAANAKPTLELREPAGDAIGFVKLAWNSVTTTAIANEAASMKTAAAESRPEIRVPRVLVDGIVDNRPFVMIEPLPRGIRHVPADFSAISEPEALGPGSVHRLGHMASANQAQSVFETFHVTTSITPQALASRAEDLARRIVSLDVAIPIANFWHGDFVRWNTGRDRQGNLWLFDWETAQSDAPAGMDTLHWYAHTKDPKNPNSVVPRVADALARSRHLLRSLGHSATSVPALAAWYATTLVSNEIRLAESLQSWDRIKHPPAVLEELLAWGAKQIDDAELCQ